MEVAMPADVCSYYAEAQAAFEQANRLKGERRMHDALGCYRTAIGLDPAHASSYNNLANTLKRMLPGQLRCGVGPCSEGDVAAAVEEALHVVIHLNPRHANAYTNLASSLRARHRFDEAVHHGRTAIGIEPRHVMAYENLGRALQADSAPHGDGGDASRAERDARGRPRWIRTALGGVRDRPKLEAAAAAFQAVIDLQGARATPNALRGLAYVKMWLGAPRAEAEAPLERGLRDGLFLTAGQYPGEVQPGLPSAPYPRDEHARCVVELLEARGAALVAEAEALLERSAVREVLPRTGSDPGGSGGGGWDAGLFKKEVEGLHTPRDGFAHYDMLAKCQDESARRTHPAFCEALDALRAQTNAQVELARVSRLQAGVDVSVHTGLHNRRWRCHLGLKLPRTRGARIWVAGEPHAWEPGKAFIFDDSFYHHVGWVAPDGDGQDTDVAEAVVEVEAEGAQLEGTPVVRGVDLAPAEARLVFIVDFLHPSLAPPGKPLCPT